MGGSGQSKKSKGTPAAPHGPCGLGAAKAVPGFREEVDTGLSSSQMGVGDARRWGRGRGGTAGVHGREPAGSGHIVQLPSLCPAGVVASRALCQLGWPLTELQSSRREGWCGSPECAGCGVPSLWEICGVCVSLGRLGPSPRRKWWGLGPRRAVVVLRRALGPVSHCQREPLVLGWRILPALFTRCLQLLTPDLPQPPPLPPGLCTWQPHLLFPFSADTSSQEPSQI